MSKNFEAIYKLAPLQEEVFAAKRAVDVAKRRVEKAQIDFLQACAAHAKCEVFEGRYTCAARGIAVHIHKRVISGESSKNKCIFCGCDNVEDIF